MYEKQIETKIQRLPEDLKRQIIDYIEFLFSKYKDREAKVKKFNFDWEGGLSETKDKFTSVEFQHKALEWR